MSFPPPELVHSLPLMSSGERAILVLTPPSEEEKKYIWETLPPTQHYFKWANGNILRCAKCHLEFTAELFKSNQGMTWYEADCDGRRPEPLAAAAVTNFKTLLDAFFLGYFIKTQRQMMASVQEEPKDSKTTVTIDDVMADIARSEKRNQLKRRRTRWGPEKHH